MINQRICWMWFHPTVVIAHVAKWPSAFSFVVKRVMVIGALLARRSVDEMSFTHDLLMGRRASPFARKMIFLEIFLVSAAVYRFGEIVG